MRKYLLILLILCAVPLYVWDTLQILGVSFNRGGGSHRAEVPSAASNEVTAAVDLLRVSANPVFQSRGRDPFEPFKTAPVNKAAVKTGTSVRPASVTSSQPAAPPVISINSIMWNPGNPVAIVNLPDGSSTIVKPGQQLDGGITIKKIEKSRILISAAGKDSWVDR